MRYEADRLKDNGGEPSLAEMTVKSIDILRQNPNGFFLMVEGGRIDHAHHDTNAYRSLEDMVAFDNAIKAALGQGKPRRDPRDRDRGPQPHADDQRLSEARQSDPGDDRRAGRKAQAGQGRKPMTTLGYANGPGAVKEASRVRFRPTRPRTTTSSNPSFRSTARPTGVRT